MKDLREQGLRLGIALALIGATAAPAWAEDSAQGQDDVYEELEESEDRAEEEEEYVGDAEYGEYDDYDYGDWIHPLRRNGTTPLMNSEGATGFHSIASAVSPGPLMFQVGLLAEASRGSDVIRLNDQNRFFGGNVLVNGSITEELGVFLRLQARNNVNTYGRPEAMLSQGDMSLGFVGRSEVTPGIWVGGGLTLLTPSSFGGVGLTAQATSVRTRLMGSFDMDRLLGADDLVVPLIVHLNAAYLVDNTENLVPEGAQVDRVERFAYGISAYNMIELGLGLEAPLPYVTPFLGWNLGIPVAPTGDVCAPGTALDCVSQIGPSAFPQTLSLGVKGEPLANLGLHAGIDIGLTGSDAEGLPVTLPYNLIFGMSWNIDTRPQIQIEERETIVEVGEPRGFFLARLVDENTGEPVGDARIDYLDWDESGHFSLSGSGIFRTYEFFPGDEVTVEISHPRYETQVVSWVIEEEGGQEFDIFMEPLALEAMLSGQVLGVAGMPAAGARVVLTSHQDGSTQEVALDEEGRFEAAVQPGLVTVAAFQEGYLTAGRDLQVAPDSEEELTLSFSGEEGDIIVGVSETQLQVQGRIDFESGGDMLLDSSHQVLDVVAAVLFENPEVWNLQIQGHSDDAGDEDYNLELTQRRAEAVKAYLVEKGISAERLEAEGYGSAMPLVPNTSRRNRNLNRRIEFRIQD